MKTIRSLPPALLGSALLFFSFSQPAFSLPQATDQLRAPAESSINAHQGDPVQTIRDEYATINKNAASYKTVKKDLSGFSAGGGTLIAYMDGPKIMKIVANHYGESGRAVEEYYYWDNQLIFIYRKDSGYDKPGSTKVVRTEENRFYFNGDKMLRWIGGNAKQVATGTSEYLQKEKDYLQLSKEFTDGARSQKPSIESSN